jgi:hypothetical protein
LTTDVSNVLVLCTRLQSLGAAALAFSVDQFGAESVSVLGLSLRPIRLFRAPDKYREGRGSSPWRRRLSGQCRTNRVASARCRPRSADRRFSV